MRCHVSPGGGTTGTAQRSLICGQAGSAFWLRGPLLCLWSLLWLPDTLGSTPGPWLEPWALTLPPALQVPPVPIAWASASLPGAAAPPSFLLQAPHAFHTQLKCQPLGADHVSLLYDHI